VSGGAGAGLRGPPAVRGVAPSSRGLCGARFAWFVRAVAMGVGFGLVEVGAAADEREDAEWDPGDADELEGGVDDARRPGSPC